MCEVGIRRSRFQRIDGWQGQKTSLLNQTSESNKDQQVIKATNCWDLMYSLTAGAQECEIPQPGPERLQTLNTSHLFSFRNMYFPFLYIYTYLVTCLVLFKGQNTHTVIIQTCLWDFPGSKVVISKCIIISVCYNFFYLLNLGLFNNYFLICKTPLNYTFPSLSFPF